MPPHSGSTRQLYAMLFSGSRCTSSSPILSLLCLTTGQMVPVSGIPPQGGNLAGIPALLGTSHRSQQDRRYHQPVRLRVRYFLGPPPNSEPGNQLSVYTLLHPAQFCHCEPETGFDKNGSANVPDSSFPVDYYSRPHLRMRRISESSETTANLFD